MQGTSELGASHGRMQDLSRHKFEDSWKLWNQRETHVQIITSISILQVQVVVHICQIFEFIDVLRD